MSPKVDRITFLRGAALAAAPLFVPLHVLAASQRIAVIAQAGDGVSQSDLDRFEARVGSGLIGRRATLVSRHRLAAVLQEQGFSNSQYADPSTASALGRILGASRILWCKLSVETDSQDGALVNKVSVSASADFELITVSTANILLTGTADGDDDGESAGGGSISSGSVLRRNAIDACATDLISQLAL